MGFNPGNLVPRELVLDDDLRTRSHASYLCRKLFVIELQSVGDHGQMVELNLIPVQEQGVRSLVIDNDPPVTIENLAACSQDGRALDSVPLRSLDVDIGILYLEFPESRNEEDENRDREVLKDSNLSRGFLRIVAHERVRCEFALCFVFGVDR